MSLKEKHSRRLKVLSNKYINDHHFVLDVFVGEPYPIFAPGQFVEVLVNDCPGAFLRRPISVHDVNNDTKVLSLLVKIVGNGSRKLSLLKENDELDLVFPLGHGFNTQPDTKKPLLLVGGGCGVAPLLHLARVLHNKGYALNTLIGGRSQADILRADAYSPFGKVTIMTEDGSLGDKGMVTANALLKENIGDHGFIYACGPDPMMKAVGELATAAGVPCEVSLENLMACGIGACLCCTAPTTSGNLRTCVEGPVFNVLDLTGWTKTVCHD